MDSKLTLDIDEALAKVGGFRRWHFTMFLLIGWSMFMPICWQTLIIVFSGWEPPHRCRAQPVVSDTTKSTNSSSMVVLDECTMYDNSSNLTINCRYGWEFDNDGYYTITEQWKLVCDGDYLTELSQTLFQMGFLLAVLFVSPLVDRLGRKPVFVYSHVFIAALGIGLAFANSYTTFVTIRTILGSFIITNVNSGSTYLLELYDTKRRAKAGVGVEVMWIFCYMTLPVMAYLITDWRILQIVISAASLIWLVFAWVLPESPQWLAVVGRRQEAEKILQQMAWWNGVKLPVDGIHLVASRELESGTENGVQKEGIQIPKKVLPLRESNEKCDSSILETDKRLSIENISNSNGAAIGLSVLMNTVVNDLNGGKKQREAETDNVEAIPISKLFTDGKLRLTIIVSNCLWFANCLLYYGLILATPSLAGNRFINFTLMGSVELPASLLALYCADRYGRRLSTCVFHIIAGIPLALVIFVPEKSVSGTDLTPLIISFAVLAKFGISSSFSIIVIYMRELFPTGIRSTGSGMGQIFAGIGNMIAPLCAYANKTPFYWLPNILYGGVSLGVGLLTLLLPETAGRPMPQNLADLHHMFKTRRFGYRYIKSKTATEAEK